MSMDDTIAAVATPAGEGGVSLLRISGPEALAIARRIFRRRNGAPEFAPWRVYSGAVADPADSAAVDEALLTYFKAPHSYTREDVVEITAHGGVYVTERILRLILAQNARLATPGEFTRRAFLNGRLDLSQAEAVADLIHAASEKALKSALEHLQGGLSARLNALYGQLLGILAHIESAIDFPEEDLPTAAKARLREQIAAAETALRGLLASYRQGKIYREGARVAIIGKPNTGKSSLLNALLQEERAIVTPIPGTTRDVLEESARVRDIHVRFIDAAGLRHSHDPVEREGMARARAAMARADIILALFDAAAPLDGDDAACQRELQERENVIPVLNKCDLPEKIDAAQLLAGFPDARAWRISARTGGGIGELLDEIYRRVTGGGAGETAVITRERHREQLAKALTALGKASEACALDLSEEFAAVGISEALEALGAILGKTFAEDLLDRIFSEFCIGK